uniref:Integrase core domain containing protein n=1 Tax=Solanum tuberosum TaxID=4113 RepID=M1DCP8_SOLTU
MGKVKGKGPVHPSLTEESSDSMGVYDTHLTTLESDGKGNSGVKSPVSVSQPEDDQTSHMRRAELRSKALHDPARISVPPTPSPPPAQVVEQIPLVLPVQAPPPQLLNIRKAACLSTILEEKILSTD